MSTDDNRVLKLDDGVEVYIKDPARADYEGAETHRRRAWNKALEDGCKTDDQMIRLMIDKGWWDAVKDEDIARLQEELVLLTKKLELGGIKKSEAKDIALRIFDIRSELNILGAEKARYLSETIDSAARVAEFDYFVYACTVNNNDRNKRFFASFDEYLQKKNTTDVIQISARCSEVVYGLQDLDDTIEKRFLKEHGYVDDQLRFINAEGHLTDRAGRLINEDGRYIKYDENGDVVFVNRDGEPIEEIVQKPFLDDDELVEAETTSESPSPKKRTRKTAKAS